MSSGEAFSRCSASWYLLRSCAGSLDGGGWKIVGRGSGFRGWAGSDGVSVGVGVWAGTVVVGVGLATGRWEEDEGVGLMGGSSWIMSIGVAVLGLVSCGRELEFSQAGPRRVRELRVGGAGG